MTDILLVDDDASFLKAMVLSIKALSPSRTVLLALNGLEAIELLKNNSISLMVTDLKMPKIDGFELLAYVMDHYPDIAVIVSTGHSIPEAQREVLNGAAISVLFKPFALHELQQTVSLLLDRQVDGGTLANVSPGTFIQLIHMEQKTCTLRMVEKKSGQMGVLFFREGKLLDARMADQLGEPAALEIFSWEHISLTIQNDCPLQEQRIKRSMNALILDATRLKDEKADLKSANVSTVRPEYTNNDIAHQQQLLATVERLQENAELNGFIQNCVQDQRWSGVLSQLMQVGDVLHVGRLKAFSIITGNTLDYMIIPSGPPTVLTIDSNCPKEKLYRALE
ncbi:MAG: response regulator [Pseudomonadota bacterium]